MPHSTTDVLLPGEKMTIQHQISTLQAGLLFEVIKYRKYPEQCLLQWIKCLLFDWFLSNKYLVLLMKSKSK